MQNLNQNTQEPERGPMSQPHYVPVGLPKKDYASPDARYKSPVLAAVLSLMPGLGQVYVGYYQQGFINIVVIAGLITLIANANDHAASAVIPFLALFMAFYWLYNLVDAYRKSIFYNQALAGLGPLEMPEGERLPGSRNSLFIGFVIVVAGAIGLSYTLFGISMEWLAHWWPVALILFGVFLMYQSLAARKKAAKA